MLLKFLCLSVFLVVYIASSQVNNKITSVLWFDMTEAMLRLIRNSDRVYLDWNNRSNRFSTKIERCYVVFCLSGWIPRGSTRFKRNLGTKNLNVSISCFDRDRWSERIFRSADANIAVKNTRDRGAPYCEKGIQYDANVDVWHLSLDSWHLYLTPILLLWGCLVLLGSYWVTVALKRA